VRKDAVAVARAIGAMPGLETLALTTNGLLLERHLPALLGAGLGLVNLSLDTLRADRFQSLTRREGLPETLGALEAALAAPGLAVKLNCVVMRGVNDDEVADFVALTAHRALEVRFIEFMPFSGNAWGRDRLVPLSEIRERIEARFPLVPLDGAPDDTAQHFRVPGHAGRVGVIASMTAPFCAGCTRLRLTADGVLKVCLFGRAEVSLRDALRAGASDGDLLGLVAGALGRKHARHAGAEGLAAAVADNRPMILIGG
jgi:cyclic pyranopterin phosphate synthase